MKTIVIWDADTLCYRSCAATEARSVEVTHVPSGKTKLLKNRTELKTSLKSKGKEFDPDLYLFKDLQDPEPMSHTIKTMNSTIERVNSDLFADEYLMCISGKANFRDDLPLPSAYKGNRASSLRPLNLKEAKTYVHKRHPSLVAKNREADDDLIIKGYEYLEKGYSVILASQDKDAMSATGLTLYDFTQASPVLQTIPDFGHLREVEGDVKGDGFLWLCFQILNGDSTDNLNPAEIANIRFGKKSAYKLLKDASTKKEALEIIIDKYKQWYPGETTYTDWKGCLHTVEYHAILDTYFKGVRMMQKEAEIPCAYSFFEQHGVLLC